MPKEEIMTKIILASNSPRRKKILTDLGLDFEDTTTEKFLDLLKDVAKERYESFPDFLYITKERDSIYCHIISEKERTVSICDYHPYSKSIIIPTIVKDDNGKKYKVEKIGYASMRNVCVNDWINSPFFHSTIKKDKYGEPYIDHALRKINHVEIPNTVTTIGGGAFIFQWGLQEIVFPKSLRIIKGGAFAECWIDRIIIPEGVEPIEEAAFWGNYVPVQDSCILSLPSTLVNLEQSSFQPDRLIKLELSPNNKHFRLINGALYSADSTILYTNLVPINTEILYIPDKLSVNDVYFYPHDSLKRYEITSTHKYYSEYKDIIYTKDFSSIISIPRDIDWVEFHPNLKYEPSSLLKGFLVLTITALTTSPFLTTPPGVEALTVHTHKSPTVADLCLAPPKILIIKSSLAPELSATFKRVSC